MPDSWRLKLAQPADLPNRIELTRRRLAPDHTGKVLVLLPYSGHRQFLGVPF
jgi:hypothetical protein